MAMLFEKGPDRYQPDRTFTFNDDPGYTINQRRLASIVGVVAFGLPIILYIGSRLGTCFYDSISHFYYAQFLGSVFVAVLVFIATFLIAYRGENPAENLLATLAGICALGVALLPTEGRGCQLREFSGRALADFSLPENAEFVTIAAATKGNSYFELFPVAGILHYLSAALLFAFLAYYSFRVFTRVIPDEHRSEGSKLRPAKWWRNGFYYFSGTVIVLVMAVMFGKLIYDAVAQQELVWWDDINVTFWLETAALWAFGFSWAVKGRFFDFVFLDDRDRRHPS